MLEARGVNGTLKEKHLYPHPILCLITHRRLPLNTNGRKRPKKNITKKARAREKGQRKKKKKKHKNNSSEVVLLLHLLLSTVCKHYLEIKPVIELYLRGRSILPSFTHPFFPPPSPPRIDYISRSGNTTAISLFQKRKINILPITPEIRRRRIRKRGVQYFFFYHKTTMPRPPVLKLTKGVGCEKDTNKGHGT